MTILVTGATGQLGRHVIKALLAQRPASELAVSVRNPAQADDLLARGVDVRHGDFDDLASLRSAFARVNRLLLISTNGDNPTRIRQHQTAVRAAQEAGVEFIAYTSLANASGNPLSLAEVHRATEDAIRATSIPYAFLRNNWYLENEAGAVAAALAGAPISTSAGQGRVGWAPRADYAEAAAAVLLGRGQENAVYELSGPPATYDDLAAALGDVLGRSVAVEHVDDATYGERLLAAGVPAFLSPIFVDYAAGIRNGALAVKSSDFPQILGRPVTPLADALRQLAGQLRAK